MTTIIPDLIRIYSISIENSENFVFVQKKKKQRKNRRNIDEDDEQNVSLLFFSSSFLSRKSMFDEDIRIVLLFSVRRFRRFNLIFVLFLSKINWKNDSIDVQVWGFFFQNVFCSSIFVSFIVEQMTTNRCSTRRKPRVLFQKNRRKQKQNFLFFFCFFVEFEFVFRFS